MDKISPTIITSRPADNHYNMIRNEMDQMIAGMSDQQERVALYRQQKDIEQSQVLAQKADMERTHAENMRKDEELKLKKLALVTKY